MAHVSLWSTPGFDSPAKVMGVSLIVGLVSGALWKNYQWNDAAQRTREKKAKDEILRLQQQKAIVSENRAQCMS